jgi:hypothetical protein
MGVIGTGEPHAVVSGPAVLVAAQPQGWPWMVIRRLGLAVDPPLAPGRTGATDERHIGIDVAFLGGAEVAGTPPHCRSGG